MRCVLVHNPGAGEGTHDEISLLKELLKEGYECRYFSTKKKHWRDFPSNVELVIIAGGDGTVRKVARELLNRKLIDQPDRLTIIPLGTANNLSKALKIKGTTSSLIRSWRKGSVKNFDVGRVFGLEKPVFMLESFGFGVFPELIQAMEYVSSEKDSPEESLDKAWTVLEKIILNYVPRKCELEIDGKDYSGNFILLEVLNSPLFGPNLKLSPESDPSDGMLEVVLVTDKNRNDFIKYVQAKQHEKEKKVSFRTIKGKKIKITWEGKLAHSDDHVFEIEKNTPITVRIKQGLLNLWAP